MIPQVLYVTDISSNRCASPMQDRKVSERSLQPSNEYLYSSQYALSSIKFSVFIHIGRRMRHMARRSTVRRSREILHLRSKRTHTLSPNSWKYLPETLPTKASCSPLIRILSLLTLASSQHPATGTTLAQILVIGISSADTAYLFGVNHLLVAGSTTVTALIVDTLALSIFSWPGFLLVYCPSS